MKIFLYNVYITHCQLKEEALDRTVWRNRFGRGFGPVVWQITDDDDDDDITHTIINHILFSFCGSIKYMFSIIHISQLSTIIESKLYIL